VATLLRFASVYEHQPSLEVIGCEDHRALAREVSAASMVLLRNDGSLLPLDASAVVQVAVLGRLAAVRNLGDGGSSDVRSTRVVTMLDGLRSRFGADRVVHADDDASIAADADVVVVVVGYTKDDEGECIDAAGASELVSTIFPPMDHPLLGAQVDWTPPAPPATGDESIPVSALVTSRPARSDDGQMAPGGDRTSLRLCDADEALIAAATAVNANVVVVVVGGSAVVMPWTSSVRAVLMVWYSGVEGGTALADVLAGDSEPAGRLPFAVPSDPAHLSDFDRDANEVVYDLFHGQWKLDRDGHPAHFPFGWGLGWGTVDVVGAVTADPTTLVVSVRNPGQCPVRPVLFVHAGIENSEYERQHRRLVGFARALVAPGATSEVEIELDWSMLDLRVDGDWITESGTYLLDVGRYAGDPAAVNVAMHR